MRRIFGSLLLILLLLGMMLPLAQAADYGAVYDDRSADNRTEHGPGPNHITDEARLLSDVQWQTLEEKARAIEAKYNFGVYIITVNDYRDYAGGDVFDAAMTLYQSHSLGCGTEKNGLLLLLSMNDRDYCLITYGDFGNLAFSDQGRAHMTESFLDDFGNDDWYVGFSDYLDLSEKYLEAAQKGEPYSFDSIPMSDSQRTKQLGIRLVIILLVPLVVASIWIGVLCAKMKSVSKQSAASAYKVGNVELTRQHDHYTHTTEVRQKIERNTSSGGGSGNSRSSRSGGFSGTRGKF